MLSLFQIFHILFVVIFIELLIGHDCILLCKSHFYIFGGYVAGPLVVVLGVLNFSNIGHFFVILHSYRFGLQLETGLLANHMLTLLNCYPIARVDTVRIELSEVARVLDFFHLVRQYELVQADAVAMRLVVRQAVDLVVFVLFRVFLEEENIL